MKKPLKMRIVDEEWVDEVCDGVMEWWVDVDLVNKTRWAAEDRTKINVYNTRAIEREEAISQNQTTIKTRKLKT